MSKKKSVSSLSVLAEEVLTRLHRAPAGVCRCGACAHQLRQAAAKSGVAVAVLAAAVTSTAKPLAVPARPDRPRRPLSAQVGTVATVTVAGRRVSLAEGLIAVASRSRPAG